MKTTTVPSHELVALDFMRHKGCGDATPAEIRQVGRFRWMFTYELAEGDLELRVEWLTDERTWRATVADFAIVE